MNNMGAIISLREVFNFITGEIPAPKNSAETASLEAMEQMFYGGAAAAIEVIASSNVEAVIAEINAAFVRLAQT